MIIQPRVRGFVCLTAHPTGCEANVREQIEYVQQGGPIETGPEKVLVIGASTGYGLASRITAAFGSGASTIGIYLEREPDDRRPATAGWYNSVAFEKAAARDGLFARSINGDAFSNEVKDEARQMIKEHLGQVDLVVYSVAAPRRTDPRTGEVYKSTLKPIGRSYHGKTLDTDRALVKEISLEPATRADIEGTVAVMGGEDWQLWIEALNDAQLLAEGCQTIAYTYIGTDLTWPIYWKGTIGKAKEDLDRAAKTLRSALGPIGGNAYVSVMKALVTQASSAIPVVPLYISVLYKVMKEKGGHEGCIEQIDRLFREHLYGMDPLKLDEARRIRMDDLEMRREIQEEVKRIWPQVTTENLRELTDFDGYQSEFLRLFGFGMDGVDYDADVDPVQVFEQ